MSEEILMTIRVHYGCTTVEAARIIRERGTSIRAIEVTSGTASIVAVAGIIVAVLIGVGVTYFKQRVIGYKVVT